MATALAQIVCVREDGKDPRTVREMARVADQIKAMKGLTKWEGQAKRPRLELWSDSGAKLDPQTGQPFPKPEPAPAPVKESAPAEN